MLNKFRRSIRKYPILTANVILVILGFLFLYLARPNIGNALLVGASIIGFVSGFNKLLDILRHGYYGIQLLPLTGIVVALLLRQPQVAAILSLVIMLEQPFFGKNKQSLFQTKHAPLVKALDIASLPFTVLIFLVAGAIWTVTRDANRFLEVIATASTAPLLLAAPLVIKSRLTSSTSQSIKLTSARVFELLSESKSIVLKKSGVLTEEKLQVLKIYTFGKNTQAQVIQVAAALAYGSPHPTAQAIIEFSKSNHKVDRSKHTTTVTGEGIIGRKKGKELLIGRFSFLESKGVKMPSKAIDVASPLVYVAENGVSIGAVSFAEIPQTKLKHFTKQLKKLGFTSIELVSGSSTSSTATIAKAAGITKSQGEMTTSEIISRVHSYENRPVIFVGNDEQDEAVLSQADISISTNPMATSASIEISDYTLQKLLDILIASKKAIRKARWLSVSSLLLTLIFVLIAATGKLMPIYCALSNLGITLLVLLLAIEPKASQQRP